MPAVFLPGAGEDPGRIVFLRDNIAEGRGHYSEAYMRLLMVHELTHALDHQRKARLGTESGCHPDTCGEIRAAVTEGHAELVARLVAETRGQPDDFQEYLETGQESVAKTLPHWAFRYVRGYAFMSAVYANRGRAGVDRVFAELPVIAEIRNPPLWLARHPPRPDARPPTDAP